MLDAILTNIDSILLLIFTYLISLTLSYKVYKRQKQRISILKRWIQRIIIILPVCVLYGLRGSDTGADTHNLYFSYINSSQLSYHEFDLTAILYPYFRWIIFTMSNGIPFVYFFVFALLTMFLFQSIIEKVNTNHRTFSLFVFYMLFGPLLYNQTRQMFAVSLSMYGMFYFVQQSKTKALVSWLLAISFHLTSLFGVLIYLWTYYSRNYKKFFYLSVLLIIISSMYFQKYVTFFSSILEGTKYTNYLDVDNNGSFGFGLVLVLVPMLLPVLCLKNRYDKDAVYSRITYFTLPARLIGYIVYFVYRMLYYFAIFDIVLYPQIINSYRGFKRSVVKATLIILPISYFFIYYCWLYSEVYFPYVILEY